MSSFFYTNKAMHEFMSRVIAETEAYIQRMPPRSTVTIDDLLDAVCEAVQPGPIDMGMRSSLDDGFLDLVEGVSNDSRSEIFSRPDDHGYSVRRL